MSPPDAAAAADAPPGEAALAAIAAREWSFDPDWITLNHGSFGARPATVRAAERAWRDRFDRQPTRFLHHEAPPLVRASAAAVARRFGGAPERLALVANATEGCNAVLRSLAFAPGDEIVVLDQTYGAVRCAVDHVAARAGAAVRVVDVPFPVFDPDLLEARLARAIGPRTALVVLDHVCAASALVLPLGRLVRACRARGVRVLVDAAHAPGLVEFDLAAIGADWHVGNLHKWMFAGSGCAFLHARDEAAARDLHPAVISHGLGGGLAAEFDWTGTRDLSAWLAIPDALAFHARLGGDALAARNARTARACAELVARALGTAPHPGSGAPCAMALVPLPAASGATASDAAALRAHLIGARIDVPVTALAGGLWLRLSAQAYTTTDDAARLAARLAAIPGAGAAATSRS